MSWNVLRAVCDRKSIQSIFKIKHHFYTDIKSNLKAFFFSHCGPILVRAPVVGDLWFREYLGWWTRSVLPYRYTVYLSASSQRLFTRRGHSHLFLKYSSGRRRQLVLSHQGEMIAPFSSSCSLLRSLEHMTCLHFNVLCYSNIHLQIILHYIHGSTSFTPSPGCPNLNLSSPTLASCRDWKWHG